MIDNWLLDRHERFSWWFQKLIGATCFRLARWCLVASFGLSTSAECQLLAEGILQPSEYIRTVPFLFFSCTVYYVGSIFDERQFYKEEVYQNKKRIDWAYVAVRKLLIVFVLLEFALLIFILLQGIFSVSTAMLVGSMVSFTSGIYFASCTPLPPRKSKLKEWFEQLKVRLQSEPSGETLPA